MDIDLRGRINNTKLGYTRCLSPVFEAIVNSIHAIQEAGIKNGNIDIFLERDISGVLNKEWASQPITSFVIQDNGIGFIDDNYRSFKTSDTTLKALKGGRGVGRLLWLKAFTKAEIESTFKKENIWQKRTFVFTYSAEGVEGETITEPTKKARMTKVRLTGFKKKYQDKCPKSVQVLARRIIEHSLEYFVQESCPKMGLHDSTDDSAIELNDYFKTEILVMKETQAFNIKDLPFSIDNILVSASSETGHCLHYCANLRSVKSEAVLDRIPNLQKTLRDQATGKALTYTGYISGKYLDDRVVAERTQFDISDDPSELFVDELAWSDLLQQGVEQAKCFLLPYTEPVGEAKLERIRTFVQTKAPEYRPVLKHCSELLDAVPYAALSDIFLDFVSRKTKTAWKKKTLRGR